MRLSILGKPETVAVVPLAVRQALVRGAAETATFAAQAEAYQLHRDGVRFDRALSEFRAAMARLSAVLAKHGGVN